jgi:hypothetical protein
MFVFKKNLTKIVMLKAELDGWEGGGPTLHLKIVLSVDIVKMSVFGYEMWCQAFMCAVFYLHVIKRVWLIYF